MRRAPTFLGSLLLLAVLPSAPAAAQGAEGAPQLPRVIYGTPEPSVIYGPASTAPERPAPAAPRTAPPPRAQPGGELTYEQGPAYMPPLGYWFPPPGRLHPPPPGRRLPEGFVPGARGGYYEPPQPPGSYVGRPPSSVFDRPRGRERPHR